MDTLLQLTDCGMLIISLGFVVTFWFRAMFAYDKIVKYECENLPEQWEKDWQPFGMFWKPQGIKVSPLNRFLRSNPAITFFRLLCTTPQWIKENPEPISNLKQLRKYTLYWNVGVAVWFVVVFPAILIVFTPQ